MQKFFLKPIEVPPGAVLPGAFWRRDTDRDIDRMLTLAAKFPAGELDGKMSESLRDILFGIEMSEDLCSRNIFRGRDLHIPSYAGLAECYGLVPDNQVMFSVWHVRVGACASVGRIVLFRNKRVADIPRQRTSKSV